MGGPWQKVQGTSLQIGVREMVTKISGEEVRNGVFLERLKLRIRIGLGT